MRMTMKKLPRRFLAESSAERLVIRRDSRTGKIVVDNIVSPSGDLVVKGGPITGGRTHQVLMPLGRTKLLRKKLDGLVELMRLEPPA